MFLRGLNQMYLSVLALVVRFSSIAQLHFTNHPNHVSYIEDLLLKEDSPTCKNLTANKSVAKFTLWINIV